jgi:predicted RNase H-like HicB family nuclease
LDRIVFFDTTRSTGKTVQKLRIQLRAVLYEQDDQWFAHCLEMDVVGHGKTKKRAFALMNDAIAQQIHSSLVHQNQANIFQPADPRFFQMYMLGQDIAAGVIEVRHRTKIKQNVAAIEQVEAREYAYA